MERVPEAFLLPSVLGVNAASVGLIVKHKGLAEVIGVTLALTRRGGLDCAHRIPMVEHNLHPAALCPIREAATPILGFMVLIVTRLHVWRVPAPSSSEVEALGGTSISLDPLDDPVVSIPSSVEVNTILPMPSKHLPSTVYPWPPMCCHDVLKKILDILVRIPLHHTRLHESCTRGAAQLSGRLLSVVGVMHYLGV